MTVTSTPVPSATLADAASSTQWPAVRTARVAMIVPEQSNLAPDALTVEPIAAHGPDVIGTGAGVVEGAEEPQAASALTSPAAVIVPASRMAPGITPR